MPIKKGYSKSKINKNTNSSKSGKKKMSRNSSPKRK